MKGNKSTAIFLGILSSLTFATTFVINRLMSNSGGNWVWSASLRYFWMFPILLLLVAVKRDLKELITVMKTNLFQWFLWGTIGFGIFYSLLTFSAAYAPSWLVASTWQSTIIAGMIIAPIINKTSFKETISIKSLFFSLVIVSGIFIMQFSQSKAITTKELLLGTIPVLIAAFAFPLGNRKMMLICENKLNASQRTLGMVIGSLPFWILTSILGSINNTLPSKTQLFQTLIIAIFSGVIATILFFQATDMVKDDQNALASIEATQSAEVLFTLLGEIIVLGSALPDTYSSIGIFLVIIGMIFHSFNQK